MWCLTLILYCPLTDGLRKLQIEPGNEGTRRRAMWGRSSVWMEGQEGLIVSTAGEMLMQTIEGACVLLHP